MNLISENTQQTVISQLHAMGKSLFAAVALVLCTASFAESEPTAEGLVVEPAIGQAVFTEAGDAANAFALSLETKDTEMFGQLLGADYQQVLPLDDVDSDDVERFVAAWKKSNTLLPEGDDKMVLAVGENNWTLPIPIVKGASGWYFDMEEGLERMRIRRIGRNELATMQAVLAYYDAQMEYAEQDLDGDGVLDYAQKFVSTPGTRDGLYWEVEPGAEPSPLGPLMADHNPGGGYHGYFYRILEAQGEHARGGAYSYMIGDKMRSGFALIAWPAEYGDSGVMSFMVSHAGIVYEQDLGPDGADIAKNTQLYDPAPGWRPSQEVNGPEAGASQ